MRGIEGTDLLGKVSSCSSLVRGADLPGNREVSGCSALRRLFLRFGRQSVQRLPALQQRQLMQRPLSLHWQHTGIAQSDTLSSNHSTIGYFPSRGCGKLPIPH